MTGTTITVTAAHQAFTEHRLHKYRGCAPDSDLPSRMAGDLDLPVGAHQAPDLDGGEPQAVRVKRENAAIEVCLSCPVMVACSTYANTITPEGKLAEPDGVWGGRRALERHKAFIEKRHQVAAAAPDVRFQTPQRQAVLRALAAHVDPGAVAVAAGVDLRTANWQVSVLVTLLNLNKASASRAEILAEAVRRGLLDASAVVAEAPSRRVRVPSPRRDRFADVEGQLALWEAELELAVVHPLFPATPLEAAA